MSIHYCMNCGRRTDNKVHCSMRCRVEYAVKRSVKRTWARHDPATDRRMEWLPCNSGFQARRFACP